MAFVPIEGLVPQSTEDGNQANGMVLKFYEPGTVTPLAVGIDSTGATQTTEFVLDIQGYTTLSTVRVIPHVDKIYKVALYLNQADADANNTGSAVFVEDNINVIQPNTNADAIAQNAVNIADNTANNTARPLDDIKADVLVVADAEIGLQSTEFVTGSGLGAALYICVPTSTVTPNGFDVIQKTNDATLSLVLQETGVLSASQHGVIPQSSPTDQTEDIDFLIAKSNSTFKTVEFDPGQYYMVDIHMNGNAARFRGLSDRQEFTTTNFNAFPGTIRNSVDAFCFIGDSGAVRNVFLKGITLIEGDETITYGIYANGFQYGKIDTCLTQGFDTGVFIATTWQSSIRKLSCLNYRISGFEAGTGGVNNTMPIFDLRCSTNVITCPYNIMITGVNSFVFYNLTTEGSADTHVKVIPGFRNFTVIGWHLESGNSIIEVDRTSLPTPDGSINITAAAFFCGSSTPGDRLLKITNSSLSGLANFSISGNIGLSVSNCDPDFLNLGFVQNSFLDANLEDLSSTPENNEIRWSNIGEDLNRTFFVSIHGTSGRYLDRANQRYSGARGEFTGQRPSVTAAELDTPVNIINFPPEMLAVDKLIKMQVVSDGAAGGVPFAEFIIEIAANDTITSTLGANNGLWSLDTLFTYDNVAGQLLAQNVGFVGNARFSYAVSRSAS